MYLLGFDIGSSSIKAALVEAHSRRVVALESYPTTEMEIISHQVGWAEQDPEIWWRNLCIACKKVLERSGIAPGDVEAIGLGYQMHGLVLVDKAFEILRPAIIWCDSRAVQIGQAAYHGIGPQYCHEHLLNPPGNFTASKLRWVQENEPHIYERIHKAMLPGDYIALRLTGQATTTATGLSEGIFWDFRGNTPSERVLTHFGFDRDLLPELVQNFSDQGCLTEAAAQELGLHTGVVLRYRAGDQPNNALSLNVLHPGEMAATCGTSGVVYGVVDKPVFDEKARVNAFAHVNHTPEIPRIGVLLCLNGAGIQYAWMKNQVAQGRHTYEEMERMAAAVPIGSEGLSILPFGNGAERMFENLNLGAQLCNLQFNRHTQAHLYRAALEGVAFSFVHGIHILREMGLATSVLRVGNDNMFRSKVFSETIATLLGAEIEVVESTGAIGAARAAGVGSGFYADLREALEGIRPAAVFGPEKNADLYRQAYEQWHTQLEQRLQIARASASDTL